MKRWQQQEETWKNEEANKQEQVREQKWRETKKVELDSHDGNCECAICGTTPRENVHATNMANIRNEWTCTVCERKMPTVSREEHLGGRKHNAEERKKQDEEEYRSESAKNPPGIQGKQMWDCEVCDRSMSVTAREYHLAGKKHYNVEMRQQNLEESDQVTVSTEPNSKTGELPGQWYCTLCSRVMSLSARESHCLGRTHCAKYSWIQV